MVDLKIRPWQPTDSAGVAGLRDCDSDALWVAQGHELHGADFRSGTRWRRTLVAVDGDRLIGAASPATNRLHAGRLSCAVEVAAHYRRCGVGRALFSAIRAVAPDHPVAGKVRPGRPEAEFVRALGGSAYQECPGFQVAPSLESIRRWCAETRLGAAVVTSLTSVRPAQIESAFAHQYQWVHETWSPVTDGAALAEVSAATVADVDRSISSAVWEGATLTATVFAFRDESNRVEIVAETQSRTLPDGVAVLRLGVARSLSAAAEAGLQLVEFDGHVSDPHLMPLLTSLPAGGRNPLLLVEIP